MDDMAIDKYDNEEIYCRKLGHHLQFNYCRQEQQQSPCAAVIRCWQSRIPVDDFLSSSFSPDEIAYLDEPPVSKVESLMDIILKAQKSARTE
jgi:hypothetical protein